MQRGGLAQPGLQKTAGLSGRVALSAGFGGLVLLMIFAGIDAVQTLEQIQNANSAMRADFVKRTRVLERIRADLYASGTYLRDYLLEPESGRAEGHRYSLLETRKDMDQALEEYGQRLREPEGKPFAVLTRELAEYWRTLEPVFQWDAGQRRSNGYIFLRDAIFPRRVSILSIADQIGSIDESQLTSAEQALDRASTGFRHRLEWTIALTVALGLLLALFSTRRILKLESRTLRHFAGMAEAREELQRLSARLVEAQEEERRSISRELHDEVGQQLTGVLVEMANLSNLLRAHDPSAEGKADSIKRLIENSIGSVRNMALLLRPSMLDDLGLIPALQWQAREASKRSGLHVKVNAESAPEDLPETHKTCIYRVVQEALHNVEQHAHARNVSVDVGEASGRLTLAIRDDGAGFDARQERGMGLLGIEERVSHLHGTFQVESAPGEGATLRIALPLEPPKQEVA